MHIAHFLNLYGADMRLIAFKWVTIVNEWMNEWMYEWMNEWMNESFIYLLKFLL